MLINGQGQAAEFERAQGRDALEAGVRSQATGVRTVYPPMEPARRTVEDFRSRPHPRQSMHSFLASEELPSARPVPSEHTSPFSSEFASRKQTFAGLAEGYKSIGRRWLLEPTELARLLHLENEMGLCQMILSGQIPPITGDLKDRMAMVIGISVGLGDLFDDDEVAEREWMNQERDELDGQSALKHMLQGDFVAVHDVLELLKQARGLR